MNKQDAAREPGLRNGVHHEEGKIEGKIEGEGRDIERSHEQREADKHESRADRDGRDERTDQNQGRIP